MTKKKKRPMIGLKITDPHSVPDESKPILKLGDSAKLPEEPEFSQI